MGSRELVCIPDYENRAMEILPKNTRDFVSSGADDEITTRSNSEAYLRWLIRPRVLRDVRIRDLSTMVLGKPVKIPLIVSPTAFQCLSHEIGEIGSAQAAESMGAIFILSQFATKSYEEIAKAAPNGRRWFQFYLNKDKSKTQTQIKRAERAGFEAMVVTIDAQYVGNRRSSRRDPLIVPSHLRIPNADINLEIDANNLFKLHDSLDHGMTWDDITWLKSASSLPLVVKGIQTPEDALLAVKHGADAIFVSNHGGRQIDTVASTIDLLPEIVSAVENRCEVYIDGGVRRGSDIFKALCLGAKLVGIGRPMIYGLAVNGGEGATKVLQILKDELDLTMALSGVSAISGLNSSYVRHISKSSSL